MSCYNSHSSIFLSFVLFMLIHNSKAVTPPSSCQSESCGKAKISFPFGIQQGCYLNEWYKIECRKATSPFLFKLGMEVVDIILPKDGTVLYNGRQYMGSIRVKSPMKSVGCSRDGKESGSVLNLTGSPFFFGSGNSLVAVGCDSKASLTNIQPRIVGCELSCTASKETLRSQSVPFFDCSSSSSSNALAYSYTRDCTNNDGGEDRSCDGNGCCRQILPDDSEAHQVIGVSIDESFENGSSTNRKCRVAFLTDEVYMASNVTEPESLFAKGYATVRIGWVIQTNNLSFVNSLSCKNGYDYTQYGTSCISATNYASCGCTEGYTGNQNSCFRFLLITAHHLCLTESRSLFLGFSDGYCSLLRFSASSG